MKTLSRHPLDEEFSVGEAVSGVRPTPSRLHAACLCLLYAACHTCRDVEIWAYPHDWFFILKKNPIFFLTHPLCELDPLEKFNSIYLREQFQLVQYTSIDISFFLCLQIIFQDKFGDM